MKSWVLLIDRPCDEGQCALKYFPWPHFQRCFGVHMQIKYLERKNQNMLTNEQ